MNLYTYCGNNPIIFVDPMGAQSHPDVYTHFLNAMKPEYWDPIWHGTGPRADFYKKVYGPGMIGAFRRQYYEDIIPGFIVTVDVVEPYINPVSTTTAGIARVSGGTAMILTGHVYMGVSMIIEGGSKIGIGSAQIWEVATGDKKSTFRNLPYTTVAGAIANEAFGEKGIVIVETAEDMIMTNWAVRLGQIHGTLKAIKGSQRIHGAFKENE